VVVEGATDVPVFEELIPRIRPDVVSVVTRPDHGKNRFMALFPKLLWTLRDGPGWVDRAIAVRDADDQDPILVEQAMQDTIAKRTYPFKGGVGVHATRRETETWMLADVAAINRVAARRRGAAVAAVAGPLEALQDAKERFKKLLFEASVPYEPGVVREIAQEIDLAVLRRECASFRFFEEKVLAR
jgi:hypothetical protein